MTTISLAGSQAAVNPAAIAITPDLLKAAEVLLVHGEFVDVVVSDWAGTAWLCGAASDSNAGEVVIRHWYDGDGLEMTLPVGRVSLTAEAARRLEMVARECDWRAHSATAREGGAA